MQDKYSAVWISHSSISDYLQCPRAYYLKNIYRNPGTGHKIKLVNPPLALGQIVHEVIESLSVLPVEKRFNESLVEKLGEIWPKISGIQGGFINKETEAQYKKQGQEMLKHLMENPGPLKNKAVKIRMNLPYFWLSEKDNIILCGKIDWLEYLPETDSVHIIDFKTGKKEEDLRSLQLPIYFLLASYCQRHEVTKVSYWYIGHSDKPVEKSLPNLQSAKEEILEIGKKIKLARQLKVFKCPHQTGCHACRPYEDIINKKAQFVGVNSNNDDLFILGKSQDHEESIIL